MRRSSRARRARLTVTREGSAVVVLPIGAPARWANELVDARRDWLDVHIRRAHDAQTRLAARSPLGGGRSVPIGGVPHRVVVARLPDGRKRTRVEHDDRNEPTIKLRLAPGDERPLPAILEPWFRAEARQAVERRIAVRARELGVSPARVSIRDQRSRWGSASRRRTVSFSWRLILAPPAVLDYVVVHELAHLADFSHSRRFWGLVRGIVPDADAARRWLRAHEVDLHHALD